MIISGSLVVLKPSSYVHLYTVEELDAQIYPSCKASPWFKLGADGLRNEVGLAFDRHGVLWGVENGADNLMRSDLGGDIHNDNPVCSQGTFCLYTLFPNILTP